MSPYDDEIVPFSRIKFTKKEKANKEPVLVSKVFQANQTVASS